jgi:hypothetical protein
MESNWDGYGACTIDDAIIKTCKVIVPFLQEGYTIVPVPNGVVDFDWETETGHACLEVGISRYNFYVSKKTWLNPSDTYYSNELIVACVGHVKDLADSMDKHMSPIKEHLYLMVQE